MPKLVFYRDALALTTWLLIGACLQSLLCLLLPFRIAVFLPASLLANSAIKSLLISRGLLSNPRLDNVRPGRYTAQIPGEDGSIARKGSEADVVVFMLGARSNHPLGLFGPGVDEIFRFSQNMWKEAEANREKWGFLGRSSTLLGTDAESSNALITLSYWKNIESLHAFALGPVHREGWDWWIKVAKQHPHIGIMHEVYAAPRRSWENIYVNFQPFGMGQAKHLPRGAGAGASESLLVDANHGRWGSMLGRMDRE